jgi:uncharacterized protein (TIGR02677 family)
MLEEFFGTLVTLRRWFDGPTAQAKTLRKQMRDAIAPMIRGQRTLAAVGGHVSRRAELLALAGRLATAESDAAAWRLWAAGTGLFAAQHLALAAPQPAGTVSFWDAAPAPIALRLRAHGSYALTGRPARIPDRSAGRATARAQYARERHAAARVRVAILARTGRHLSGWGEVDEQELATLLTLLAAIATAPVGEDGLRTAVTGDGLWHVIAYPPPPGTPSAVLHTGEGRLVHPDVRLLITDDSEPDDHPPEEARTAPRLTPAAHTEQVFT